MNWLRAENLKILGDKKNEMETCYEEVERGEIKNLQKYQKNRKQEIRKSSISETSHKLFRL